MLEASFRKQRGGMTVEVDLAVEPRGTLVLVGESGAGKTTVLRILAGLERPEEGRVILDGRVWSDTARGAFLPPEVRDIGWVPQDYALFPHLSVMENVAFGLRARRLPRREVGPRAHAALERVGLGSLSGRRVTSLSGGQQQRVALARALVVEPRVLLLDEPLAALDLATRRELRGELRSLLAGLSCLTILVTHSPAEALVFGERIAVLEGGRVTQLGSREELLCRPRSGYVAEFMGVNLLRGRVEGPAEDGQVRVATAGGQVTVAGADLSGEVFLAVSPREITLFRDPPAGSARNVYRGRVLELIPEPPFGERIRAVLDTRPRLVAEVTRAAVDALALAEGQEVYAAFKATGVTAYA